MPKRVYIDTSIPSAYYTLRTDTESITRQRITRQWWEEYVDKITITSSTAVILELIRGNHEIKNARLDLLKDIEIFESTFEIQNIVQVYIDKLIMPKDPFGDALHLAIASFHELDTLLTWNCIHLANSNKQGLVEGTNKELGLSTPELATPLTFLGGINSNE